LELSTSTETEEITPTPHFNPANAGVIKISKSKRFEVGWSELTGRRLTNEDAILIDGCFLEDNEIDLYGLFDGHAGNSCARFCANNFSETFKSLLNKHSKNYQKTLYYVFQELNTNFIEYAKNHPKSIHTGTTALVVMISKDKIYSINLGDTRAVLCRNGIAIRLSYDHKPLSELERIRSLDGHVCGADMPRINGALAVGRSIGDFYASTFVSDEPYFKTYDLKPDDEFLILACDGVFDKVNDQLAVDLIRNEKDPYKASMYLRDYAFQLGSTDNITVIVVKLK